MQWLRRGFFLLLILVCLIGAGNVMVLIDSARMQFKLATPFGSEAASPEIVLLTHLLGGFRSLLVDAIWFRAGRLQEEKKYWELYQLYDWMGKLEPHLEKIWTFNAWNMSYNLAAELDNAEGRWRWVTRGMEYLRSEGLKYNPESGPIMKELAWIYYHKIGKGTDLYNLYYKHRLALDMNAIVGDYDMQDMKGCYEAPRKLEVLLADPGVALALKDFNLSPDDPLVGCLDEARGIAGIRPAIMEALMKKKPALMSPGEFVKTDDGKPARKVFNYVAAKTFRERLNMGDRVIQGRLMDGLLMCNDLEEVYGKFDWRLPEPHALFWGMMAGMSDPNLSKQIDYDRMVLFSIQQAMRRGIISLLPEDPNGRMMTTVDLAKIKPLDALYERLIMKHPDKWDNRGGASLLDGHMQFLQESELNLYMAGYHDAAARYHAKLKERYDKPQPWMPVRESVLGKIKKGIDENWTPDKAKGWLDNLIRGSLILYCQNKFDQARKWDYLGKRGWDAYYTYYEAQKEGHGFEKPSEVGAPGGRVRHAGKLPTYEDIYRETVRQILLGRRGFPPLYRAVLADRLGLKSAKEAETWTVPKEGIVPGVAPTSPEPE